MNKKTTYIFLSSISLLLLYWFLPEIKLHSISYNDGANHLAIIRRIHEVYRNGGQITDFWMPHINFGHALLRSYQFLMHVLIWIVQEFIFSNKLPLEKTFNLCITVFVILLPWSFYKGARLFSLTRTQAALVALFLILIQEEQGYGISLVNASYAGYGTYNQLFANLFVLPALGYHHHYLREGKYFYRSVLLFCCLVMSHILSGYFAALWMGFDLALSTFEKIKLKHNPQVLFTRIFKFTIFCFGTTAFWIIPMIQDLGFQHISAFESANKWTGPGLSAWLSQLISGKILDGVGINFDSLASSHFPIITFFSLLGFFISIKEKKYRYLSFLSLFWILISAGPAAPWGIFFAAIPFSQTIHWHRAFAFAQISLLLLAAIGFEFIIVWLARPPKIINQISALILIGFLFYFPLNRLTNFYRFSNQYWLEDAQKKWNANINNDYQQALKFAQNNKLGRYYLGSPLNWGNDLKVTSYIPWYGLYTQFNIETVGSIYHHQSHTETLAFNLDIFNPIHLELANIRYIGLKKSVAPPKVDLNERLQTSNGVLYEVKNNNGYFGLGQTTAQTYCMDSERFIHDIPLFLNSKALNNSIYPRIEIQKKCNSNQLSQIIFNDPSNFKIEKSIGKIESTSIETAKTSDRHSAHFTLQNKGIIFFKMNAHPNWIANLDGTITKPFFIMPGFMAVEASPGKHSLSFEYQSDWLKKNLNLLSLIFMLFFTAANIRFQLKNKVKK